MKFKHYLLMESNYRPITHDFSEIREILHRDCKKILSIYRSTRGGLFRGEEIRNSDLILKQSRLENRKPKHTPQDVHDLLNKLFKNKFGWNVRNGVFVSSKFSTALVYGRVYFFFPKDGYKFCWSPKIEDLFSEYSRMTKSLYQKAPSELTTSIVQQISNKIEKNIQEYINTYTNKNLQKAIQSKHEISFNIKEYYLLMEDPWSMEFYSLID